jgi:iron complex outermembrane receptor protein
VGYLPQYVPDVTDYSAVGGVFTHVNGWTLDLSGSHGHNDFQYDLTNTMNVSLGPCLGTPCAPGPDGIPGNSDDPGIPNQTDFFAGAVRRNETIGSVSASRAVSMGARPVNVALGAAFRHEQYGIMPGERASWIDGGNDTQFGDDAPGGSQVFPGFTPSDSVDASRDNVGGYLDLESNLSEQVLANVAGRFEHYSDFGSLFTGKGALRVQPSRRVTLRAAGSTGFRAPGLGQSHFSKVVTNFIAGEAIDVGIFPVDHPASVALGAKPLKAEKSVNLSAGIATSPADNVTLTADVFQITITDRILLGATFDDAATTQLLDDAGITGVGGVQYFTNGLDTRTRGIDLTGEVRVPVSDGAIVFHAAADYTKNTITDVDPLPQVLRDAGSTETGLLDVVTRVAIEEERPDWRVTFTPTYTHHEFHALARASYYGKFASAQPGYCDDCREEYGAKTLFDAEMGYKFQAIDLSLGVKNAFDTYPDHPTMDFNNNFGTFPWAAASPFGYNGRYVYARASLPLLP